MIIQDMHQQRDSISETVGESAREPNDRPQKGNSVIWIALVILMLGYMLSVFHRIIIAIMADKLMQDLQLNPVQIGFLASIYFYPYAFMQFPIGIIADRIGVRGLVSAMMILAGLASVSFALADSFTLALFLRFCIGLFVSGLFVPTQKFIATFFPPQRFATIASFLSISGMVGSLVASLPLAYAVNAFGWRTVFDLLGILTGSLGLASWFLVPKHTSTPTTTDSGTELPNLTESIKRVLTEKGIWPIAIRNFLSYGSVMTFQSLWAGPYLMVVIGLDRISAGYLLMLLSIGQLFTAPFSGYLSNKVFRSRKKPVLLAAYWTVLFWVPLAFFSESLSPLSIGILLTLNGLLSGISTGAGLAQLKELFPSEVAGTAIGLGNVFTVSGPAIFPVLISFIMANHADSSAGISAATFAVGFRYLLAASVIAAIAISFSKETLVGHKRPNDHLHYNADPLQ